VSDAPVGIRRADVGLRVGVGCAGVGVGADRGVEGVPVHVGGRRLARVHAGGRLGGAVDRRVAVVGGRVGSLAVRLDVRRRIGGEVSLLDAEERVAAGGGGGAREQGGDEPEPSCPSRRPGTADHRPDA
jgi:hypothetical protein